MPRPITEDQALLVAQAAAVDRDGRTLGRVVDLYWDDHTGRPTWVAVRLVDELRPADDAGVTAAPLASASYARGLLTLDVTADQVVGSPRLEDADHLDAPAEVRLYRHYGLSPAGDTDVDPGTGSTVREGGSAHSLLPPA